MGESVRGEGSGTEGYGFDAPAGGEEEPGLFAGIDGGEGREFVGGRGCRGGGVWRGVVGLEYSGGVRGEELELECGGGRGSHGVFGE